MNEKLEKEEDTIDSQQSIEEKIIKATDSLLLSSQMITDLNLSGRLISVVMLAKIAIKEIHSFRQGDSNMVISLQLCNEKMNDFCILPVEEIVFRESLKLWGIKIINEEYLKCAQRIGGKRFLFAEADYTLNCSLEYFEAIVQLEKEFPKKIAKNKISNF